MRCLNPSGKVIEDLRVLMAYAQLAADREETQEIRLCAYSELLTATGYDKIDHDHWRELEWFLEDGGSLEQAPLIDWKLIGSVLVPNVAAGNVMTVSAAIVWPTSAVPAPGHYCFIVLVGNAQDPAPNPATFLTFDNYYAFIRNNNNVAWRNFDVVTAPAPGDPGRAEAGRSDPYALDFAAPGAADSDRYFALAVGSRLPPGSRVSLEAPLSLLGDRLPFVDVDKGRQTGQVPIGPHGRTTLPPAVFPAKSRSRCRLLVHVPRENRERDYEVYVSQLYEGFEVGRVTWRIVARK